jgi:hypothetical protein
MEEKYYNSKDTEKIIKKALKLQHQSKKSGMDSDSMTLDEISSVGKEIGLSSELINLAAMELEKQKQGKGGPVIPGADTNPGIYLKTKVILDKEKLEELSDRLNQIIGEKGDITISKKHLNWSTDQFTSMQRGMKLSVSINVLESGTLIEINENLFPLSMGLFGGLVGGLGLGGGFGVGFGVGIGVLGSLLFSGIVSVGFIASSIFLSKSIYRSIVKYRKKKIEALGQKLMQELET